MSNTVDDKEGPPIGTLHEVSATFSNPDAMQDAVSRLETSGFDRADLSLPEATPPAERITPEAGAKAVDTEEDARQARTLHSSGAAAAVAAAVVGGGVAGGLAYALTSASNEDEQRDREGKAARGALILSVRAPSAEKRAEAETILRAAGATEIEVM